MGADITAIQDEELIREFGLLLGTTTRLERIVGRTLERRVGITHVMFEVLLRLSRGPQSMSCLAKEMILTSGGMTRLIDRMERAGLVARCPSSTDRRVQRAALTDRGGETLARAERVHCEVLREFFAAALTAEQRTALTQALSLVDRRVRSELPSLG